MNIKKLILRICIVIIAGLFIFVIYNIITMSLYKIKIKEATINNIDLSKIKDGEYTGKYDAVNVKAEIKVTIKNHKIYNIEIINHYTDRGKKAEKIIDNVIKNQSLNVDVITGATNSSKVILKAIDNALISKK